MSENKEETKKPAAKKTDEEKPLFDNGDVEIAGSSTRGVWLAKVPKYIAETWRKKGADSVLGQIFIDQSTNPPKVTLVVPPSRPELSVQNEEYPLNLFGSTPPPLYILSATPQGKAAIEGFVDKSCIISPKITAGYESICKDRTTTYNTKSRFIQKMEKQKASVFRAGKAATALKPPVRNLDKHTRKDREELENDLFELFGKQQFWNLKALKEKTEQPLAYLKEVLEQLCTFHHKGPNKGLYELKQEYKTNSAGGEEKEEPENETMASSSSAADEWE